VYVHIHTNITCMHTHLCARLCCLLPLLLCEGVTAGDLNDGILCHPCGVIITFPPGVRGRLPTVVGLLSSSVGAMALLVPGRLLASPCVCCSVCVAVCALQCVSCSACVVVRVVQCVCCSAARAGSATSQPLHVSQCVRCRVCVAVCVLQRMLCSLCVAVLLVSCRLLVSPTAACTHEDSRKIHACIHIYI